MEQKSLAIAQVVGGLLFCLAAPVLLAGQRDSSILNSGFRFEDGVYRSLDELRGNQPAYTWDEVSVKAAANAEHYRAQAEYVRLDESGALLPSDSVWAIVLDGLPYVRLAQDTSLKAGAMAFAGLRVRGRICYYRYERQQERLVEITAYNPLTGRPFRKGNIKKPETVEEERVFHLFTGDAGPLSRETLLRLVADDDQMVSTVEDLPEQAGRDRLYKCVLIYDDRNPVYLPKSSTSKK